MLLRFRVANHRSIRDPAELSFVAPSFSGTRPEGEDWVEATNRVAALYGANGSGKSNVLDALDFLHRAVRYSATSWGEQDSFPHRPFALDRGSSATPSHYEIDLVIEGVRYVYGFQATGAGVTSEWLHSYQTHRRTVLFERDDESESMRFGRRFSGQNTVIEKLTRRTALFLSVAANNNHDVCTSVRRGIIDCVRYARYTESDRLERIRWARERLEDPALFTRAEALIRFADLGIDGIELTEDDAGVPRISTLRRALRSIADVGGDGKPARFEELVQAESRQIEFRHRMPDGDTRTLELSDESNGTVAWLSLVVPALHVLDRGDLQIVDELDASLHPRLSAALVRLYKDPVRNPRGAQLLFTSHDTTLMGSMLGDVLDRAEVWFTEKKADGATELYALEEFSTRSSDNIEKRYLEGRYGALPVVQNHELQAALSDPA